MLIIIRFYFRGNYKNIISNKQHMKLVIREASNLTDYVLL
jgi:hypothetical protein